MTKNTTIEIVENQLGNTWSKSRLPAVTVRSAKLVNDVNKNKHVGRREVN